MKTKLGHYVVFDITAYLPGRKIPKEFCDEASRTGVWFFQPAEWAEENHWGGIVTAWYRNFPMIYSTGHKTAEEALSAAQEWEDGEGQRKQYTRRAQASILGEFHEHVAVELGEIEARPQVPCGARGRGAVVSGIDCLRAAYERVGWIWDPSEARPVGVIVDEAVDDLGRGSDAWAEAHGYCVRAGDAAERCDIEECVRALVAADRICAAAEDG